MIKQQELARKLGNDDQERKLKMFQDRAREARYAIKYLEQCVDSAECDLDAAKKDIRKVESQIARGW